MQKNPCMSFIHFLFGRMSAQNLVFRALLVINPPLMVEQDSLHFILLFDLTEDNLAARLNEELIKINLFIKKPCSIHIIGTKSDKLTRDQRDIRVAMLCQHAQNFVHENPDSKISIQDIHSVSAK